MNIISLDEHRIKKLPKISKADIERTAAALIKVERQHASIERRYKEQEKRN